MPSEDGVRGDDGRNLPQKSSTEPCTEPRQATPFLVGQPHALVSQLRLENLVLLAEIGDHLRLFPLKPPEETRDNKLRRNHVPSLR